jgi:hypothetical protein
MVSRACPVCGSDSQYRIFEEAAFDASRLDQFAFSSRKVPEYMHYRLLECGRCDLLYANPLPAEQALEAAYREAAFDSSEEARYASQSYAEFLPGILARLSRRAAALDIGTGDGAFLEHLLGSGFERVVGVEPSRAPVEAARERVRGLIRQSPFRPSDFEPASFSLITCFQTSPWPCSRARLTCCIPAEPCSSSATTGARSRRACWARVRPSSTSSTCSSSRTRA